MSAGTRVRRPVLVIAMGVSGSGKSTLAARLAQANGLQLLEADDFHPLANRERMARGEPLTDAMREPWVAALCAALRRHLALGDSCVLACSGLRRAHRQRFRELGCPTLFFHLTGDPELVRARLRARTGHFAPADLLDSQLLALEAPAGEDDVVDIDLTSGIDAVARQADKALRDWLAEEPRP